MRVSVLGLGSMGSAFAGRALETGHQVTVWNRSPGKADALRERGASVAGSAAEAVAAAELSLLVLADDGAVRSVALGGDGSDGVLAALPADGVLANVSTVAPDTVRALAAAGPPGRVLEAEVMGSPSAISAGAGKFLLGGPAEVVERFAPLWTDLGRSHLHCGEIGSGAVCKLVSNLLLITGVGALAEAIATARAQGIPDELLRSLFTDSPVVSAASQLRLEPLLDPAHPGWFSPELAAKDLRLAIGLAGDASVRIGPATEELLSRVIGAGHADFAAVIDGLTGGETR
jgi:3-hydroxyisobutyrate dehydrogenase-like beta-hydroxyacid dehydrogenase